MGLRDIAETGKKNKQKNNLLELSPEIKSNVSLDIDSASLYSQAEVSFSLFLRSLNIEKAGFLYKQKSDVYSISFPIGISVDSFERLIIPAKLINKNIEAEKNWIIIKGFDLSSFKSFFAPVDYATITEIILFSLKDDKEFLMFIRSQDDKTSHLPFIFEQANTKLDDFIHVYMKYRAIFASAMKCVSLVKNDDANSKKVQEFLALKYKATLFKISFNSIFPDKAEIENNLIKLRLYYSFLNKIIASIGKNNIAISKNELKLCIFSKQPLVSDLYFKQIKKILNPIYGNVFCDCLILLQVLHSENEKEIFNFLSIQENDKASKNTFGV